MYISTFLHERIYVTIYMHLRQIKSVIRRNMESQLIVKEHIHMYTKQNIFIVNSVRNKSDYNLI